MSGLEPAPDPSGPGLDPGGLVSGRQLQLSAMRGSFWTAVNVVVSVPFALVTNAVVARVLGVGGYGTLALLSLSVTLVIQIANGGFDDALIREGAIRQTRSAGAEVDLLLRRSLGYRLVAELPVLVLAGIVVARGQPWPVLVGLLGYFVSICLFNGAPLALTIENRTAVAAQLTLVSSLLAQVAVVVLALATHDAEAVLAGRLLVTGLLVPLGLLLLAPGRRRQVLRPLLPRRMPAGFWTFAVQSLLAGLLAVLVFSRSEVLVLRAFTDPAAVGVFALAFGLSYQLTAPVDAMLGPLLPAAAGLLGNHPGLAERAFLRATRFAALIGAAVTAVALPTVIVAVPLIYGAGFARVAALLVPLGLVSVLQSVTAPVTAFVVARRGGARLVRAHAVALVLGVAASVVLIPLVGVWGAVVGNVVGQLVSVAVLARGELRELGLARPAYGAALGSWLCSVPALGLSLGVAGLAVHLGVARPLVLVLVPFLGAGLAWIGLRWGRSGLTAADREAVLGSMSGRRRSLAAVLLGLAGAPERG